MAQLFVTIDSIIGGQTPAYHASGKGQFLGSQAIDPEQGLSSRPSGHVLPVSYAKFSGSAPSGAPMWITTDPNDLLHYIYHSDGEVITYDTSLASETVLGTPTSGAGNGAFFYNNYQYFITPTDVSRYGPISKTPALVNNVWTGTTLGSQKALIDTSYPTIRNAIYPNHAGHPHVDGAAYFCDFNNGKGLIHKIKTADTLDYDAQAANFTVGLVATGGTSGATGTIVADADAGATGTLTLANVIGTFADNEALTDTGGGSATVNGTITPGAGNNGSAYGALDLPPNVKPFDIESYGNDLAIVGSVMGTSAFVKQGSSYLFLWDTISDSFYRQVPIPGAIATAVLNVNGELDIWAGSTDTGWQKYRYNGGFGVEPVWSSQEGSPPFAGAVDSVGSRTAFGAYQATIGGGANVLAQGYQNGQLGRDAMQNIAIVGNLASGSLPIITSLKYVQQQQGLKQPIVGWRTSSDYGTSKIDASAVKQCFYWTQSIPVNKSFKLRELRVPLTGAVSSAVTISIVVTYDDRTYTGTLTEINNTNFSGETFVRYNAVEIDSAMSGAIGRNNIHIEFQWSGTSAVGLALPIEMLIETLDD